jgi:hypothetical protein
LSAIFINESIVDAMMYLMENSYVTTAPFTLSNAGARYGITRYQTSATLSILSSATADGFTILANVNIQFVNITLVHNSASGKNFIVLLHAGGVVRLSNVTVNMNQGTASSSNFFVGAAGLLNITSLSIKDLGFDSTGGSGGSFIQIGSVNHQVAGGLTVGISNSTINNLTSSNNRAAFIADNIQSNSTSASVTVRDTTFTNINVISNNGAGGLIHLSMSEASSLSLRFVNISSVSFSATKVTNGGLFFYFILIYADSMLIIQEPSM